MTTAEEFFKKLDAKGRSKKIDILKKIAALGQYECKMWIEFQNKYSKKLIVTVECFALERDWIPYLGWVEINSSNKKIQGDGKNLDTLLTEAKKIMKPISDFIENEIQPKIDSSRKAKKDSHSQLTIDFIEAKI